MTEHVFLADKMKYTVRVTCKTGHNLHEGDQYITANFSRIEKLKQHQEKQRE